jgi:hypothetical protein
MNMETEPINGVEESAASIEIELSRLIKSDAALKQEVALLKEANLGLEKRLAALEVKAGEPIPGAM